jgi:ribosomal protein S12 methylthiotransferase accessory factor
MARARLSSRYVNRTWEPMPYAMSAEEKLGIDDLFRFYNPFGPIRKILSSFGARGTTQAYVAYGLNYDLDHVLRRLTNLPGLSTQLRRTLYGGGKSHTLHGMFLSSIGEVVERGLGALQSFEGIEKWLFGARRELVAQGHPCLAPAEAPLFAPEQYESEDFLFSPFTDETPLTWIEGQRLLNRERIWVPAQLVGLYHLRRPGEAAIGFSTSVGLACHISEREALYHGILEAFERDAVNLRWFAKIPLDIIEIDRAPTIPAFRRLTSLGLPATTRFYLNSLDMTDIPVVTAIQIDERLRRFSYYAGSGVELDIDAALFSAWNELGQSERDMRLVSVAPEWQFSRNIDWLFKVDPDARARELTNFLKVIPFYGYAQNQAKLSRYLNAGRRVPLSTLPKVDARSLDERWAHLLKVLARRRIDPIVIDYTPPQMRQLRVMKAYIPDLIQAFPPSQPMLGHPRFYEVPYEMGLSSRRLEFEDLSIEPLPYP